MSIYDDDDDEEKEEEEGSGGRETEREPETDSQTDTKRQINTYGYQERLKAGSGYHTKVPLHQPPMHSRHEAGRPRKHRTTLIGMPRS